MPKLWKRGQKGSYHSLSDGRLPKQEMFRFPRLFRGFIWRVSRFDPLSFSLVVLILVTAGLMACFWPALRAASLNPMVALRHE